MSHPLRVLIVEDSADDALLLLRELRRGGYDPASERVETPEDFSAALAGGSWDLVIADYALPAVLVFRCINRTTRFFKDRELQVAARDIERRNFDKAIDPSACADEIVEYGNVGLKLLTDQLLERLQMRALNVILFDDAVGY